MNAVAQHELDAAREEGRRLGLGEAIELCDVKEAEADVMSDQSYHAELFNAVGRYDAVADALRELREELKRKQSNVHGL